MALRLGVAALLCLLLIGCTEDESAPGARPSASPTFAAGEPCPQIEQEESIPQGCITEASGDVDGDGKDDVATVFAQVNQERMPLSWWLVVETSTDRPWDVTWRLRPAKSSYPRMVGIVDANGDNGAEVFVKVSDTGNSSLLHVFGIAEEGLFRYFDERGEPFTIEVGGSSAVGRGAECTNADDDPALELVKLRVDDATSDDPQTRRTVFEWRGQRLGTSGGRIKTHSATDQEVRRYYRFSCGELEVPLSTKS